MIGSYITLALAVLAFVLAGSSTIPWWAVLPATIGAVFGLIHLRNPLD